MRSKLAAFIAMMVVIALVAIGAAFASGGEPTLTVGTPSSLTSVSANTLTEPSSTLASEVYLTCGENTRYVEVIVAGKEVLQPNGPIASFLVGPGQMWKYVPEVTGKPATCSASTQTIQTPGSSGEHGIVRTGSTGKVTVTAPSVTSTSAIEVTLYEEGVEGLVSVKEVKAGESFAIEARKAQSGGNVNVNVSWAVIN